MLFLHACNHPKIMSESFAWSVIAFSSLFIGNVCYLSISPKGPVSVEALVGTNVTLSVSHAGVPQPEVMWFKGSLLVAKWTVGNSSLSGVASGVFKAELNGSLTFMNVSLRYNGTYTVEMNNIGEEKVSATFYLFVYGEYMENTL